jgi:hypothetical protein
MPDDRKNQTPSGLDEVEISPKAHETGQEASKETVPTWFPIAGVFFGTLTLVFFMSLVFLEDRLSFNGDSRFFVIAVFGLGSALSVSFMGGSAAASGKIPIPFVRDHPVRFSVAGGIATLVVATLLAANLFPHPTPPTAEPGSSEVTEP